MAIGITRTSGHGSASAHEIFTGDVYVAPAVGAGASTAARIAEVTFVAGGRTRWHRHSTDQILVVTGGSGIVADDEREHEISVGDVVVIPAGERHWHGSRGDGHLTHLAILPPGSVEEILDR